MYSKAEAARIKKEFWTSFGKYLSPIPSSDGEKINWINYHTGYKHFYLRMDVNNRYTRISVEISHPDNEQRNSFYERLLQLKKLFENSVETNWIWEQLSTDEDGKQLSRIYTQKDGVNIYDQRTWPEIISFLKPRIIALDEFWNNVKYGFEDLR